MPEKSKGKVRTFFFILIFQTLVAWWGLLDLLHLSLVCLCVKFLFLFFVVFDILRFLLFHLTLIVLMITKVSFLLSLGEALQKWFALWSKLTSNSFDQMGVEGECFLKRVSLEALKMQYCCLNSAPQKLSPNFTVVKDNFQH